jgi:hypothetical protein
MPDVVPYATPSGPAALERNRAGGLVAFGIINLLASAVALSFGVVLIAMMISGVGLGLGGQGTGLVLPVVMMSLMITSVIVVLIWLGIGSIRRRRWVRPLTLSLAWLWLAFGASGTVSFLIGNVIAPVVVTSTSWLAATTSPASGPATLPTSQTSTPPMPPPGATLTTSTTWSGIDPVGAFVMLAAMTVFMLVLPIAYILFYRSPHVRQTLEVYDPQPRWTDRRPLPVLGISVWCVVLAWSALLNLLTPYTHFFGGYVVGPAAAGLISLETAILACAAVLCYRQNLLGWWLALAYVIFAGTSLVATHWVGNVEPIRPILEAMESEDDARPLVQRTNAILYALGGVLVITYLLRVRRYFEPVRGATAIPAVPA